MTATSTFFTTQAPKLSSEAVVAVMFRDPNPMGQTCDACNGFVKQWKKAGYTNLLNHLMSKHEGYEDVVRTCIREKKKVSMEMFVDRHALSTYQWMNLVAHKTFAFTDVDDPTVRSAVKFDSISSKTLKARMNACVELIEPHITEELKGERFVLVFDGVTDNGEHSLAVFVVTRMGWRLLALSSFLDEHSMTADEHTRFLDLILDQYKFDISNIVSIVCDNMETNKAISRRIRAPMIGCAAHRFNLVVKDHLRSHTNTIKTVSVLMRKLKSVKRIALLKKNGFNLKPIPMHELRWSGIHRMLKRYKQLQPFLYLFGRDCEVDRFIPEDVPEDDSRRFPIVQYLPSPSKHCSILELLDDMEVLEVATKRLQQRNLTLLSARDILDETLVDFPDLEDRLGVDANIVDSPAFEAGVVKIMQGQENQLTSEEIIAVTRLERTLVEDRLPLGSSAKRKQNKEHSSSSTASKKKRNNPSTIGASVSIGPHGG